MYIQYINNMSERPIVHSDMFKYQRRILDKMEINRSLNVTQINGGRTITRSSGSEYVYWEERKETSDIKREFIVSSTIKALDERFVPTFFINQNQ